MFRWARRLATGGPLLASDVLMGINEDDIQRVRDETDLVAVISQYVALKRSGRRWVGLCPFHGEKTPSFSVNSELGFYHCFGCQRSGDAITFVREIEGFDFPEAIEWLAGRAGITLRYTDDADGGRRRLRRKKLLAAVAEAVEFYHRRLMVAPDAGPARGYLRTRGYGKQTVEMFKLGWAPDEWDALARSLRLGPDDLESAGLGFLNRRNRVQDSFRARVMFPIFDAGGTPVGFGARQLPGGDPPKYKNTSETEIYSKSRVLYGLNWAKKDAVSAGEMIVCEGYTDVIGYFEAGLPRAVATCGTALTEEHVKLMKRFVNRLVLSFDADGAGRAAADRFYEWEKKYDIEVLVADLPEGADPGELARDESTRPRLREAVEQAVPFLRYRIDRVMAAERLDSVEGRARAAQKALELVAEHPDVLVRDQYLMDVADRCRVEPSRLRALADSAGAQVRSVPNTDPGYVPGWEDREEATAEDQAMAPDPRELELLRAHLAHPEALEGRIEPFLFSTPVLRRCYELVSSGPDWYHRIDEVGPTGSSLLRRLAVEEPDAAPDPIDVLGRVVASVAATARAALATEARRDREKFAVLAPHLSWLQLRTEELADSTTRPAALDALLAWLKENQPDTVDMSA